MTFEEWIEIPDYQDLVLILGEREALKAAYQAGYEQGYEDSCEEVVSKQVKEIPEEYKRAVKRAQWFSSESWGRWYKH